MAPRHAPRMNFGMNFITQARTSNTSAKSTSSKLANPDVEARACGTKKTSCGFSTVSLRSWCSISASPLLSPSRSLAQVNHVFSAREIFLLSEQLHRRVDLVRCPSISLPPRYHLLNLSLSQFVDLRPQSGTNPAQEPPTHPVVWVHQPHITKPSGPVDTNNISSTLSLRIDRCNALNL